MYPSTSGPTRRQLHVYKWNRPMTKREADTSKFDFHLIQQRDFGRNGAEPESLLNLFLEDFPKSPRLRHQRPVLESIFGPHTLEDIGDGKFDETDHPVAWLRDMDQENDPRDIDSLMSAKTLHQYTTLKRFNEQDMVDALRRRIYIPDPSSITLGILVFRSSIEQSQSIRTMIYNYLKAKTEIGLSKSNPSVGREFCLEFHVRCPVWRNVGPYRPDKRLTTTGKPLRESRKLSFLSSPRGGEESAECSDFLYESQVSICVMGWDTVGWTAIDLMDTYFDEDTDDDPRMLSHYDNTNDEETPPSDPPMLSHYDNTNNEETPPSDPLSLGNLVGDNKTPKDPREYFLYICMWQLRRVSQEWENTEHWLGTHVEDYLHRPHILLRRQKTTLGNVDDGCRNVEESEMWSKEMKLLIEHLTNSLEPTLHAVDSFIKKQVGRIDDGRDEELSSRLQISVFEIVIIQEQLEKTLYELKAWRSKVESFQSQLGLHLAVDNHRAIVLQHWNVTILQFFSPLALAGSIMQTGLVAGNVFVWFTILSGTLLAITWKMQALIQCYDMASVWWRGWKQPAISKEDVPPSDSGSADASFRTGFSLLPESIRRRIRGTPGEKDIEQDVG